ncbi:hypothetical protein JCM8115_000145 [Rhodotorula mucilaginosa]
MATTATGTGKDSDSSSADNHNDAPHIVVPVAPVAPVAAEDGTHSATAATRRLRHGRGPIIQDDDDEEEEARLDDPEAALARPTTTAVDEDQRDAVDDDDDDDDEDDDDRKPLLANGNGDENGHAVHKRRRGRRGGTSCASVCCIALSTLFISFLIVLALAHLWIGHLISEEERRHAHESAEQIVQRGLLVAGPSAIRIVTPPPSSSGAIGEGEEEGNVVVVEMDIVMGMDVRKSLGWQDKDGAGRTSWRARTEAKLARWAVSRADHVNVRVHGLALYPDPAEPTTTLSLSNSNEQTPPPPPLVRIDDPSALAFSLPLSYPSPNDYGDDGLRTETYTFTIPLTFPEPKQLVEFGKRVWDEKWYRVRAEVEQVVVIVGGGGGAESGADSGKKKKRGGKAAIERWIMDRFVSRPRTVDDVVRVVQGQLPEMPEPPQDPSKMVDLVSLSVFESPSPLASGSLDDDDDDDEVGLATTTQKNAPSPSPEPETVIAFAVSALLKNPLREAIKSGRIPPVGWSMPFRLPIEISLPLPPAPVVVSSPPPPHQPEIALARVSLAPFGFGEMDKQAEVSLTGYVVPAGNLTPSNPPSPPTRDPSKLEHSSTTTTTTAPQAPLSRALSRFVARYLSGRSNDVFIRYDSSGRDSSPPPTIHSDPARDAPLPPRFVADLVRDQVMKVSVPGTNETPELFKDLRMEDMKVKLGGRGGGEGDDADLLASGRVVGEVVLPEMAQGLAEGIDAKWIWPDVLVYEGDLPHSVVAATAAGSEAVAMSSTMEEEVSSDQVIFGSNALLDTTTNDDDDDDSVTQYPPSPIPATAFARMRPSSSMTAETIHLPANGTHAARTLVSAQFVDAPLYLLPGRGDVLRRFVGKIIFGGKATASMKGLTSVRIGLSGFGEVELVEIPIEASFLVGRGGVQNPPSLAELVGLA